jgi:methylenetetrahydrofolate dehydrogenase (NADP+)/methenyltetrahydrofolate cyclohydrolase
VPSTAAAAFYLLDGWLAERDPDPVARYRRSVIVVVGRSPNVGRPAVALALARDAAVVSVDVHADRAGRLAELTRVGDIVVVAAGRAGLIRAEHVKESAIVVDIGINPLRDPATGRIRFVGDVDARSVAPVAAALTPVPGGVGPVTDVWLLRNVTAAAEARAS